MGYYTNYDFSMNSSEVISAIEDVSQYGKSYCGEYHEVKWYDNKEDMKKVSLMFPDQVLQLDGAGEEEEDRWKAYFKNGKCFVSKAKITVEYEPFSESKLK